MPLPVMGATVRLNRKNSESFNCASAEIGGRMGLIITLIVFVGLAAIIVWIADWTSGGERRSTALDSLNQRLARGEIDRAEYEEKRKLIGR